MKDKYLKESDRLFDLAYNMAIEYASTKKGTMAHDFYYSVTYPMNEISRLKTELLPGLTRHKLIFKPYDEKKEFYDDLFKEGADGLDDLLYGAKMTLIEIVAPENSKVKKLYNDWLYFEGFDLFE